MLKIQKLKSRLTQIIFGMLATSSCINSQAQMQSTGDNFIKVNEVAKRITIDKKYPPSGFDINNVDISEIVDERPKSGHFQLFVRKTESGWRIIEDKNPNSFLIEDGVEALNYDPSTNRLSVIWDRPCQKSINNSNKFCSCAKGLVGQTRKKNGYQMCNSELTSISLNPVSVLSTAMATAMYGIIGSTSVVLYIDPVKVSQIVTEADLAGNLDKMRYEAYQEDFEKTKISIAAGNEFFQKYSKNYDPDQLSGEVSKNNNLLVYRKELADAKTIDDYNAFAQKYKTNDPEKLIPMALRQRDELADKIKETAARARLAEIERTAREKRALAELNSWRKNLKIGSDTFCGSVIEARAPMYKIAINAPLQGYASEVWLNDDKIFMPEAGCRNVNGRLSPLSAP